MVLEHLFPDKLWEKHFSYAALLGFFYAIISILIASAVFGGNTGIVSVMFVTLFLLPSLKQVFKEEELIEEQEKRFSIKRLLLDNRKALRIYGGVFVGVFFAYLCATFLLPQWGISVINLVREQLFLDPAVAGRATGAVSMFARILANNWLVLLIAFVFALIWSDGALFFVSWNASAWGAIFGFRAYTAALAMNASPWLVLGQELGIVVWHTAIEGSAYILAAVAGSVISVEVMKKSDELKRFVSSAFMALVGGALASYLLSMIPMHQLLRTVLLITVACGLLYLMRHSFTDKRHKEVFTYNYWLFVMAIGVFIIGVIVETWVLSSSATLSQIYASSAAYLR